MAQEQRRGAHSYVLRQDYETLLPKEKRTIRANAFEASLAPTPGLLTAIRRVPVHAYSPRLLRRPISITVTPQRQGWHHVLPQQEPVQEPVPALLRLTPVYDGSGYAGVPGLLQAITCYTTIVTIQRGSQPLHQPLLSCTQYTAPAHSKPDIERTLPLDVPNRVSVFTARR